MQNRLASVLLAFSVTLANCAAPQAPTFVGTPFYAPGTHFTVIGDLQATLPVERLIGREDNDFERRQLLPEVARTNPAFVVLLGDLVSWGASATEWEEFDENADTLRRTGIPVFAVPGNHDYFGGDRLRHYFARFPHIQGLHWYERRYGQLGMIFLDSNAGPLDSDDWADQKQWYDDALKRFDADDSVLGVVVFLHHAPLTNSSLVGDDQNVLQAFVPGFRARKKTMAMFTGHAHGYERFHSCGKEFVVTGGGGGPRSPLLCGNDRRHPDEFAGPEVRNFNFVELSLTSYGLHAFVVGLPKGSSSFCRMETFELPWPAGQLTNTPPPNDSYETERERLPACYPQ
jgi:Icc-related predicted phosphoesterase